MPLIVDYTKAEKRVTLEKGLYPAHQVSAEVKPSKTSEYPNVLIKYVIDDNANEQAAGTEHEKYYGTSPKAIEQLKKAMCAMGHVDEAIFDDPKKASSIDFEKMAVDANGLGCQIRLTKELQKDGPFEGEYRNSISGVLPVGVSG